MQLPSQDYSIWYGPLSCMWATINTNYMRMMKDSIQYGISHHSIVEHAIPSSKVYICSQYTVFNYSNSSFSTVHYIQNRSK